VLRCDSCGPRGLPLAFGGVGAGARGEALWAGPCGGSPEAELGSSPVMQVTQVV